MYTLNTFLLGHELRLYETQTLASGSVAFDKVHFDFDDSWAGLSKVALFWGADGNAYGAMVDAEDTAVVPWEALATGGRIKFGVYGVTGSGDDAVRATSTLIHYKLPEGAWTEDGQQPTPAEQTIIEQAIAAIQSAVENLDREPIIRNGIWYTWDIHADDYVSTGVPATGPIGPQGPKGDTGDVTPAAQQAASDAQAAAQAAAGSASAASGSAQAAAGSAQAASGSAAAAATSAQAAENAAASIATDISVLQSGLAIIVSGDRASMAVPVGGYAYIKDNTHGLAEGLYTNTSSAAFPTVGGTADSTVFTAVSGGGLNAMQQKLMVKSKTETLTFDANGFGQTSLSRSNTILFLVCDTTDWYTTFRVFGNDAYSIWTVVCNELKNTTHTVLLYYFDV